jgi:hypothetical protein
MPFGKVKVTNWLKLEYVPAAIAKFCVKVDPMITAEMDRVSPPGRMVPANGTMKLSCVWNG